MLRAPRRQSRRVQRRTLPEGDSVLRAYLLEAEAGEALEAFLESGYSVARNGPVGVQQHVFGVEDAWELVDVLAMGQMG